MCLSVTSTVTSASGTFTKKIARQETASASHPPSTGPSAAVMAAKAAQVATIGATLGVLGACLGRRNRPKLRALQLGALGGAIGFGAGLAWRTRALAVGISRDALRKVSAARNQRWLERHPINYA